MNTRIAMSGLSIVAALAMMSTSALAAFTATATNTGNTFGTGTLVLNINSGTNGTSTGVFTNITNFLPGTSSTVQHLLLKNTGSIPMNTVSVTGVNLADGSDSNLAGTVHLKMWVDADHDGTINGTEAVLADKTLSDATWNNLAIPGATIPATTGQLDVAAMLVFPDTTDQTLQGKSVTFSIGFQGNQ